MLVHEYNNSSVSVSQCCGWQYVVDDTGSVSLSVGDSLFHEYNNYSSVSVSQCCGLQYVVDVTGLVSLSVGDSLVHEYNNSSVSESQCCGW